MPATVADPNRSLDSEQISPATIAHHTVYEKIPNLHQSHMYQWGAQPYLVGPLSRLVGKPPFSPWLSRNILPLKRAANGPNSAISLTQTFDRISFCVYNSLYFGVQKAKNGDRGKIVFTATLNCTMGPRGGDNRLYPRYLYESRYAFHKQRFPSESYIFLKKNQNTPRPSEHPPVMGEKMSKRLGGIKRLQIQNLFMAFKQVPRCR